MGKPTKRDLEFIRKKFTYLIHDSRILGIILYGSYAVGEQHIQSDIDICIVAPKTKLYPLYDVIMKQFPGDLENFDIRFFEELPLLIRQKIVNHGIILYSRDKGELSEYFFFSTRKEYEDYQYRLKYII